MWIFTPVAFVSVAFSREDPEAVMFRFRTRHQADAFNQFYQTGCDVLKTPAADYRYRIILQEADASALFDRLVGRYFEDRPTNVKAHAQKSGASSKLMQMMHSVWGMGMGMQDDERREQLATKSELGADQEDDYAEQFCENCTHYADGHCGFHGDDNVSRSDWCANWGAVCAKCATEYDTATAAKKCCELEKLRDRAAERERAKLEAHEVKRLAFIEAHQAGELDQDDKVCLECWHYGEFWDFTRDSWNGPCCPSCGSLSIPPVERMCKACGSCADDVAAADACCRQQ